MEWLAKSAIVIVAVLVTVSLYARLAPSDLAKWHVPPIGLIPGDFTGSAIRIVDAPNGTLARLDKIIQATPRTQVLAGSVEEGMITYITRSAVFGFPDYTTVSKDIDKITIHGRLRIGRSDLGVNAERIDGWLSQL